MHDAFRPILESMIDGVGIKSISEALNLHLLRTLKSVKSKRIQQKIGAKAEPT